jgi:Spy/CpxP family protein refolding chaperone
MRSSNAPVSSLRTWSYTSLVAVGLAAASLVGCGGAGADGQSPAVQTATETPALTQAAAAAPAVEAAPAPATDAPEPAAGRPHAHGPFAMLEALDLRPEQRAKLDAIRADLETKMDAGRNDGRELAGLLAAGIETGKLDDAAVRQRRVAVQTRIDDGRKALAEAANAVHATLDPEQRAELVLTMRAKHAARVAEDKDEAPADGERRHHRHGIGRLATELGLTAAQVQSLQDGVKAVVDAAMPDRAARRERMEVERKAAEDAFMTDSFDAHRYTFGMEAVQWMQTATVGATALSDLATSVLTQEQRSMLAQKIREGSTPR